MATPSRLGDLQLAILRVLWRSGEASANEVHEFLRPEHGLALTTIATMLRKMEDKDLVRHRSEGRQFVYRANVAEDQIRLNMVGHLIERMFAGDPKALVNHLLDEGDLDLAELDELRRRVREAERKGGKSRG